MHSSASSTTAPHLHPYVPATKQLVVALRVSKAPVKASVRVQSVKPGGDNFDLDSMMAELEGGSPVRVTIYDLRSTLPCISSWCLRCVCVLHAQDLCLHCPHQLTSYIAPQAPAAKAAPAPRQKSVAIKPMSGNTDDLDDVLNGALPCR